MYMQFLFKDGSNPYITKSPVEAFKMFCKYNADQVSELTYMITGERTEKPDTYFSHKNLARDIAIEYQCNFDKYNYSYSELSEYQDFFETIGIK